MEYIFNIGFLGTHAPYYIDIIIIYLSSLPILIGLSIYFAINRRYSLHHFMQIMLFIITLTLLVIFNYKINLINSIEKRDLTILLNIYIFLSMLLLIMWLTLLVYASEERRRKALPGLYSKSHRKSGRRVFSMMLIIVLSSIYIYRRVYL